MEPPYILVGDSCGSYNVRLYTRLFPEKVARLVLTDALHEEAMSGMSFSLVALKLFLMSAFAMCQQRMHAELLKLSTNCTQLQATRSGHFVWIDEPEIILAAIREVLQKLEV
jgi:pimeloyl-ACP methyl ester carboxylesterase